jgi:threonine dehydratase
MRLIDRDDIAAAYTRIGPHIRHTPVIHLGKSFGFSSDLTLKLESLQHSGSFKARGAFNALLSQDVPRAGVTAASGGNHGAAVAYAAQQLGFSARIFVPEISSPAKVAAIHHFGAEVVIGGARYADAQEACDLYVAQSGALKIHPYDSPLTMAGQGTIGLEWDAQGQRPDTVLVSAGGGGLVAGIASWWHGEVAVISVEPEGSRALQAALAAGGPVDVDVESVAADSLGARNVGALVHATCDARLARAVLVPDKAIIDAQRLLWRDLRLASEPGAAAALAALLCGVYRPAVDEKVGILICGANVDLAALAASIV